MEEITGEADYVNAPEGPADKKAPRPDDTKKGSAPEGPVDTKASPPGLRFVLPIAVCWIVLLAIMGLRIYFDTLSHKEKEAINTNSFGSNEFWIGLRVVNAKWKWVDGSDLTESSWIADPDPAE
ncbi:hypothetical protein CesoFtcFv8_000338, partial [Champsocephalus esox]